MFDFPQQIQPNKDYKKGLSMPRSNNGKLLHSEVNLKLFKVLVLIP